MTQVTDPDYVSAGLGCVAVQLRLTSLLNIRSTWWAPCSMSTATTESLISWVHEVPLHWVLCKNGRLKLPFSGKS